MSRILPMDASHLDGILDIESSLPNSPVTRGILLSEMAQERASLFVACDSQNRVLGYIDFWTVGEEAQLLYLAVRPDARRQGLGMRLLEYMEALKKPKRIFLEVRASNLAARSLYQRRGFSVIAKRSRYYQDGEDALVMEKTCIP